MFHILSIRKFNLKMQPKIFGNTGLPVVFSDLLSFVIFVKRFVKFYVVNEARFLKINVCFINENNYFY